MHVLLLLQWPILLTLSLRGSSNLHVTLPNRRSRYLNTPLGSVIKGNGLLSSNLLTGTGYQRHNFAHKC